jgi:hypothetical protein
MSKYNGFPTNQEAKRIYNFCAATQPYNIFGCFLGDLPNRTPPVPPKPGKMKAVFLLNLTTTTNLSIKNTLNYYWQNYPQEFIECPIVDTNGSLEITLQLLDEYYGYGFKYFIGFQTSTIMAGVLASNWFNFHPDAIGISPSANSNSLNIPKNIYRFLPDNSFIINSINNQINDAIDGGYNIYYIYTLNQLVCEDALRILNQTIGNYTNYVTLGTTFPDLDTPTMIQNFLDDPPNGQISDNDILIILLLNRNQYLTLYSPNPNYEEPLTFPGQQYDILASVTPIIPSGSQTELANKYNVSLFKGVDTSILWRNGYNFLGSTNYSTVTLNILNLLNQFSNNEYVGNINSHYGALIFDPVTKDIEYPSILLQKYNGSTFINTNLYVDDPYLGIYTAEFTGSSLAPTDIIPISPNKPFKGKAIALLELTNSVTQNDIIFNDSLYYYWYEDLTLPKFPIIDTAGADTINDLLDTYYNQGYRIFLGMTRSNVLLNSLSWFTNHPDAIGISLLSAATLPSVPKNIFRLNYSDSSQIQLLRSFFLDPAETIFYIYKEGNAQGEAIYNAFNYLYPDKLKTLVIDVNETNLNASTLNTFFDGNTANDIIFIYLQGIQTYIDVYDDPTMLPTLSRQYNAAVQADPNISDTAGTKLNLIYFNMYPTYPNTSFLWNENRQYLTEKYEISVNSFTLLNAMTMIDYILLGKDIKLLGSHSGVLQFSETTRTLLYTSLLFKQYQYGSQSFVNYNISFEDPLLGIFIADFI